MACIDIHDLRSHWGRELFKAGQKRGHDCRIVNDPSEIRDGYGFNRVNATPRLIGKDKKLGREMARKLKMITDLTQIEVYDSKLKQFDRWKHWMPDTWVFRNEDEALCFAEEAIYPLVSKGDVGASSKNVRILESATEAIRHIEKIFSEGVEVNHCAADGVTSLQRDYVYFQRFIPHEITYRVNIIGNQRAVFFRKCYDDRPVAQTGNTTPAYEMSDELESLLEYANGFFIEAGTKWCALDILKDGTGWKLLETSLAWPHPSPGDCNNATFFPSRRKWIDMWDVLMDELSAFG